MGRVKEAVLASLARPIVSSRQCWHPCRAPLLVPSVLASLVRPIVSSVSAGILGAPHCQYRPCAMVSVIACFFLI